MRLISLAPLAVAVSHAGGLGFIGAGTDLTDLNKHLTQARSLLSDSSVLSAYYDVLPIGVGFINWGAEIKVALKVLKVHVPAAVWFFAPHQNRDLVEWTTKVRKATLGKTKIWVQVGTVAEALEITDLCNPDVLVIQGSDAGGHGLERGAGIIALLPEVADALKARGRSHINLVAAGGIVEGRGVAACLTLGAHGVVMGTRFLASKEASIAKGYQDDVLRSSDGGIKTVRSKVYDTLRGTTGWPARYGGRGIINQSYLDANDGEVTDEMRRKHDEALKMGDRGWGEHGRLTAYAGSGVGLVERVEPAEDILIEVRSHASRILTQPRLQML
ncbi:nitronate monooxygenase [Physcia stellaris]|nr:nitronate monooxygenase [Physcia stellaris]